MLLETAPDTVLVCDRYSAYKKLARELAGMWLAWCWSHQRRDFHRLRRRAGGTGAVVRDMAR